MKIIIIGCGGMGSGLALSLSRKGHSLTVIDRDPATFQSLGPAFKGLTLVGPGMDREILLKAGIERADGLASLTSSDEVNVVTARLAIQFFKVPRVVARVYDPRKAEVYRRLGLQTISPLTWGINRAAELLSYSQLDTVMSLGGGEVELVETEVPALLAGRTVSELTTPGETTVVAISRNGQTFLPSLGTVFQKGDLLHLAVYVNSVNHLKRLLAMQ